MWGKSSAAPCAIRRLARRPDQVRHSSRAELAGDDAADQAVQHGGHLLIPGDDGAEFVLRDGKATKNRSGMNIGQRSLASRKRHLANQ